MRPASPSFVREQDMPAVLEDGARRAWTAEVRCCVRRRPARGHRACALPPSPRPLSVSSHALVRRPPASRHPPPTLSPPLTQKQTGGRPPVRPGGHVRPAVLVGHRPGEAARARRRSPFFLGRRNRSAVFLWSSQGKKNWGASLFRSSAPPPPSPNRTTHTHAHSHAQFLNREGRTGKSCRLRCVSSLFLRRGGHFCSLLRARRLVADAREA